MHGILATCLNLFNGKIDYYTGKKFKELAVSLRLVCGCLNCREQFLKILLAEYQKNRVREIFVYEYSGMTYHVLWSAYMRCSSALETKGQ